MTELQKIMRRVKKKQPDAELVKDDCGNLFVCVNDVSLSEEHLLPDTQDELTAWKYADISLRMTQNFNRTHPLKVDGYAAIDKKERVKKRKSNARVSEYSYYD